MVDNIKRILNTTDKKVSNVEMHSQIRKFKTIKATYKEEDGLWVEAGMEVFILICLVATDIMPMVHTVYHTCYQGFERNSNWFCLSNWGINIVKELCCRITTIEIGSLACVDH